MLCFFLFGSCTVEPQKINYGKEACSYCKMNIVDQQHAAEIVTDKGRAYKYDAIECMLNELNDGNDYKISLFLVNTYDSPKELFDATSSTYLISEAISSPMGANLSAFKDKNIANKTKEELGGELYNWDELKLKFLKK